MFSTKNKPPCTIYLGAGSTPLQKPKEKNFTLPGNRSLNQKIGPNWCEIVRSESVFSTLPLDSPQIDGSVKSSNGISFCKEHLLVCGHVVPSSETHSDHVLERCLHTSRDVPPSTFSSCPPLQVTIPCCLGPSKSQTPSCSHWLCISPLLLRTRLSASQPSKPCCHQDLAHSMLYLL